MNEVPPIASGASEIRKRFPWLRIIIISAVILLVCVPPILWFFLLYSGPGAASADAGFNQARKTIDPELLRAWAMAEIPKYPFQKSHYVLPEIPRSEIPAYLEKLYSVPVEDAIIREDIGGHTNITVGTAGSNLVSDLRIAMQPDRTNGDYVQICWGGPFFHWMFEVGPTNFVLPPDKFVTSVEWVPGIYYTREDTAHPFQ